MLKVSYQNSVFENSQVIVMHFMSQFAQNALEMAGKAASESGVVGLGNQAGGRPKHGGVGRNFGSVFRVLGWAGEFLSLEIAVLGYTDCTAFTIFIISCVLV